ncbi:hypothetical protein DERF_006594, partial [Dermatophagoides farinae]
CSRQIIHVGICVQVAKATTYTVNQWMNKKEQIINDLQVSSSLLHSNKKKKIKHSTRVRSLNRHCLFVKYKHLLMFP